MKNNIIKSIFLSMLLLIAVGCENPDADRFTENPNTGWIEVTETTSTTGVNDESTSVFVEVTTPIFSSFSANYKITAVQGDFTKYVSSSAGTVSLNSGKSRIFPIEIALKDMMSVRNSETIFDVTIVSTNNSSTSAGVSDGTVNVTTRVTIPCNEPANVADLINFDPNYLTGDYTLADGNTSGTIPFFGAGQDVTISVGNTPTERVFRAIYFEGTRFAGTEIVTLEIVNHATAGNIVILKESVTSTLSCNGVDGLNLNTYTIDADAAAQADLEYTQYSVCDGGPATFEINVFEIAGGCADNQFSTFTIAKK